MPTDNLCRCGTRFPPPPLSFLQRMGPNGSNVLFIYAGKPKGAMITHGNIASNTSSVIKILEVCLHFHLPV